MPTDESVQQYTEKYSFLVKATGSDDLREILNYIKNAPVKDTTRLMYLNSVISLRNIDPLSINDRGNIIDDYVEYRDNIIEAIKFKRGKDNLSERQRAVADNVSMNDIQEMVKKMEKAKNESLKDLEDYILIYIMSNSPLRNDLMDIRVTTNKSDSNQTNYNWIYVPPKGKATLTINQHKTSGSVGVIVFDLDANISNDIRNLIANSPDGKRMYLFENANREPYSSSAFTHLMNRITNYYLGTPFSSTMFRKIYDTHKYSKVLREMEADARRMGHSLGTAREFYIDRTGRGGGRGRNR